MPATFPPLSAHIASRQPSAIRVASIQFAARQDDCQAVNVAIGNVSLPMHPRLQARMKALGTPGGGFDDGVVKYTPTVGTDEARSAFLKVIEAGGFATDSLHCQITDGGSQAMELCILATCGPAGSKDRPLLLIDAAYTNYKAFADRLGRATVSIRRELQPDGKFSLPSSEAIEEVLRRHRPGAVVIIPYDNPTGALYNREMLIELSRLAVKYDLWILSDEAYRELHYTDQETLSIWALTEAEVPGITGRRISIETASKVWNACGLRLGALITDNLEFHQKCVAENTASLCSSAVAQHIFAGLGEAGTEELQQWFQQQRDYYKGMMTEFSRSMKECLPGVVVSRPDASLYSVVEVKNLVPPGFKALDFVLWCANHGKVEHQGAQWTLLTAPMAGFYSVEPGEPNPGDTQMRIAFVETPERMKMVPMLFAELFKAYLAELS